MFIIPLIRTFAFLNYFSHRENNESLLMTPHKKYKQTFSVRENEAELQSIIKLYQKSYIKFLEISKNDFSVSRSQKIFEKSISRKTHDFEMRYYLIKNFWLRRNASSTVFDPDKFQRV